MVAAGSVIIKTIACFMKKNGSRRGLLLMQNTLGDLNNHLFAQLERLNDEDLKGEKLVEEISRTRAINEVASRIIANGSLVLSAKKLMDDHMNADIEIPAMLGG
jgi:hypothetical protein